jgi:hypothetical protein
MKALVYDGSGERGWDSVPHPMIAGDVPEMTPGMGDAGGSVPIKVALGGAGHTYIHPDFAVVGAAF